jgi:hypothetical protein
MAGEEMSFWQHAVIKWVKHFKDVNTESDN